MFLEKPEDIFLLLEKKQDTTVMNQTYWFSIPKSLTDWL